MIDESRDARQIHRATISSCDARFRQAVVKALSLPDTVNDITLRISPDGTIQATYTQSLSQTTVDNLADAIANHKGTP